MSANVFDLQGSITMDTSGFEKAIKDVISEGKSLVKALTENTTQMKALQDSVSKVQAQLDSAAKAMKETADATATMAKEADKTADATDDMKKEINDLKSGLDKTNKAVEDTVDETKKLAERMDKAEAEAADLKTEVDRLGKEYDDTEKDTKDLESETKKLGNTADDTAEKFKAFAEFLKTGFAVAAKATLATITAAGVAVAGYTKQAFDAYSQYEQLEGGIKTLFGDDASKTIMKNAENAANTAGMSINNYLDTVMGFSSSLIQATGRGEQTDIDELKKSLDEKYDIQKEYWDDVIRNADSSQKDMLRKQKNADLKALKEANKTAIEEAEAANMASTTTAESLQKAADLADVALRDMSDNANKFGTNIQSIQNAYQGFAKQNYTMLDNLKLGYGGTKEEMERLLSDAEKLTGKEFKISSYADIVEAIHAIQEELGIINTTKDEAAGTLEGSAKAMSAAWDNLKLAIASGDVEKIEENIAAVISNVETVISNSGPVVVRILEGIATALPKISKAISEKLPGLISEILPPTVKAIEGLISSLVGSLPELLKVITDKSTVNTILVSAQDLLRAVLDGLESVIEEAPEIIPDLLDQVGNALINGLDMIGNSLINILPDIERLLYKTEPVLLKVIAGLFDVIAKLSEKLLPDLLPDFVELIGDLIVGLADTEYAASLYTSVGTLIGAIADMILNSQEPLFDALDEIITVIFTEFLPKLFSEHGDELGNLFLENMKKGFELIWSINPLSWVLDYIVTMWGKVIEFFFELGEDLADFDEKVFWPWVNGVIEGIIDFFEDIGGRIYDFKEDALAKIGEWIALILVKITDLKTDAITKAGEIVGGIVDKFTGLVDSAKQWGEDLITNFIDGVNSQKEALANSMGNVAGKIASYIHFSEPDEGPLSDFHTYGPDMMQLLAEGIRDNAYLVTDQIDALANNMSEDLSIATAEGTTAGISGITIINNISLDGARISNDYDLAELSDELLEKINEGLAQLDVFQTRAYGGVTI